MLMLALRGKLLQELVAARTMDLGEHRDIRELGVVVHTWGSKSSTTDLVTTLSCEKLHLRCGRVVVTQPL